MDRREFFENGLRWLGYGLACSGLGSLVGGCKSNDEKEVERLAWERVNESPPRITHSRSFGTLKSFIGEHELEYGGETIIEVDEEDDRHEQEAFVYLLFIDDCDFKRENFSEIRMYCVWKMSFVKAQLPPHGKRRWLLTGTEWLDGGELKSYLSRFRRTRNLVDRP